jgi:pyrimidine dimer DNA glycosylase
VQTFLPFPDFERSARALDPKRLGKQRVEALQVLRALTRDGYGWASHPAVLMWKGFEEALGRYGLTCCAVWTERGYGDTCAATIGQDLHEAGIRAVRTQDDLAAAGALPTWLGEAALHRSHQSSLLRKDPEHYAALFPGVPDDLPYVWPIRSPTVLEAERRKVERLRRRRSLAAAKGWRTRRANDTAASGLPDTGRR